MKKIMFNDRYGLTQAVLQGRKTMTRRVVGNRMTDDDIKAYLKGYTELVHQASNFKVGEVVAVAQPYKVLDYGFHGFATNPDRTCGISRGFAQKQAGWNNKMFVSAKFMPHQIRITDIKIERLQDISDEDCLKEGIMVHPGWPAMSDLYVFQGRTPLENYLTRREAFAALIDKVSGKGTWERNPYVFVYIFNSLIK